MSRLDEIKAVYKQWSEGKGAELDKEDTDWLIEQAEKYEKTADKLRKVRESLNKISNERDELKKELRKRDANRT